MKMPQQFFDNFERFSHLSTLVRQKDQRFSYEFMEDTKFMKLVHSENAAGRGPGLLNRIYAQEILFRAHWAAVTSVWRNYRWMHGMDIAMKHPNYFAFCASLRGFVESAADSYDVLSRVPAVLANNFASLRHALAGKFDHGMMMTKDLEDMLIHYAYARKIPKGTAAPTSHAAKTAQDYLTAFEETGSREIRDLYAELCEITHPAAATVHFFVEQGESDPQKVTIGEPEEMEFIAGLVSRHDAVFAPLFQKSFNAALIALRILNRFDDKRLHTPGVENVDFSKVPVFSDIEKAIKQSKIIVAAAS
jgi:hypothetical protein